MAKSFLTMGLGTLNRGYMAPYSRYLGRTVIEGRGRVYCGTTIPGIWVQRVMQDFVNAISKMQHGHIHTCACACIT